MKKATVKGTNDYLPKEVRIRDYLQNKILEVYQENGFSRITTPVIEDAENLDKSEGGENLNLIFKILKRGEKLEKALEAKKYDELSDMGLRYDLTLPLSRYFANNRAKLMYPIKCIQIDRVYRAERPQKGRLREFVQCDIDILGSDSYTCEIELITVTAQALLAIGMKEFKVKVNNRKILKSVLMKAGFTEDQLDSVCITFDKLDKVSREGVIAELREKGMSEESITNFADVLSRGPLELSQLKEMSDDLETIETMEKIIASAKELSGGAYDIVFDLSLVRGQGYYTGSVFEIESTKFRGAIGGGGRYDNLIGKFTGEAVPAVGFSIGFERIFSILSESQFEIPDSKKKVALLYQAEDFVQAMQKANVLRGEYDVVMYEKPKKVGKFLNRLTEYDFYGYLIYGEAEEVSALSKE